MLNEMIITAIEDVFTVDSHVGRRFEMHDRKSYGITLSYSGKIIYHKDGEMTVSDREHIVLLPKGQDYLLTGEETGLFPVINVQCVPEFTLTKPVSFRLSHPEQCLKRYEQLREIFLIGKERARCFSVLYDILSSVAYENKGGNRISAGAVAYIEKNYTDPTLDNDRIADELGISEVYLRRVFKESLSVTPKQYILELRYRKAKQLLSEGILTIHEIAEECGFSGAYHFSRAFRQSEGMSPTEYRNTERRVVI